MRYEFSKGPGVEKLASGAQATIYRLAAGTVSGKITVPLALKKYKKKVLDGQESAVENYITRLIAYRAEASDELRDAIDRHTIWPLAVAYENGRACGFVMRLIPALYRITYRDVAGPETVDANLAFLLNDDETRRRLGQPVLNRLGRARITRDLLHIVARLHQYELVIGDVSLTNILVAVNAEDQSKSRVLLIDTDSFRRAGETNPLKQAHTGDWIPPESMAAGEKAALLERAAGNQNEIRRLRILQFIQNKQTDVYKICLAILRLYHDGPQRTTIVQSQEALRKMARELSQGFAEMVHKGLTAAPASRPDGRALLDSFYQAVAPKRGSKT